MSIVPWVGGPALWSYTHERFLDVPVPAAAIEQGVWRPGRTVSAFRDGLVEAIIGTKYSSVHPDREWIVVDLRIRALGDRPVEIGRDDISLRRADGSTLALPDRGEIAEELSNIGRTLIASSTIEDSLDDYLPPSLKVDRIPFVTRSMLESIVLEAGRIASGKLLFRAPRGIRIPAAYTFRVSNRDVDIRIPFRLPAYDLPGSRAAAATR